MNKQPDIGILYSESVFSEAEIQEYKNELSARGLILAAHEQKKIIWASLDFFVPIVHIVLSREVMQNFFIGFATSLIYDWVKLFVKTIWGKVKQKKPKKLSGGKIEDYRYPIHITYGNISAVFPTNIDESIVNHYIDKLFEHLNTAHSDGHFYAVYNENTDCFENYSEAEIIDREIKEQKWERDTTDGREFECNTQQGE